MAGAPDMDVVDDDRVEEGLEIDDPVETPIGEDIAETCKLECFTSEFYQSYEPGFAPPALSHGFGGDAVAILSFECAYSTNRDNSR